MMLTEHTWDKVNISIHRKSVNGVEVRVLCRTLKFFPFNFAYERVHFVHKGIVMLKHWTL